jgi:iron-sulfur cluster assembly accessory protein
MQSNQETHIITLTEKAAEKIRQMIEKEGNRAKGFRVGVLPGGCSGYMYEMTLEENSKPKDRIIEQHGVKVFISPESVSFLQGSTVDYKTGLMNAGFKISNPNVKRTCGCGHSVG